MSGEAEQARGAAGMVAVRWAHRADVARIFELMKELARYERLEDIFVNTEEAVAEYLFEERWPKVECLVAEGGGGIVAYALFYGCYSSFRGKPVIWLEDLCVTAAARGSGAGKALMRAMARLAVERGCSRIAWDVLDWNQPAIGFYEGLGASRGKDWYTYTLSGDALEALGNS